MDLISSKREGEYWDFKEQYHNNKADLLHDIICMANNRADQDAYIIFGVSDDYQLKGVHTDENRKTQQQIIDFLKSKTFSGHIRPTVELHTLQFGKIYIDVLIIKNTDDTPYFITEDYRDKERKVRANYIYTRVGDTNTDINKSADINHIEYLWKKRFKINRSPLEQIKYKLQFIDEWKERDNEGIYYHEFNPEFTLKLVDYEDKYRKAFYSYTMTDDTTAFGSLKVRYFETTLFSHEFVVLDGGRYITTVPEWGFIKYGKYNENTISYKYYIIGSLNYLLHKLLTGNRDEALIARRSLYDVTVIFMSESEKDLFESYVRHRINEFKEYLEDEKDSFNWIAAETEQEKKHVVNRIKTGMVVKKMLNWYRIEKDNV